MASRLELHEVLCNILNSRNVYFQSPASVYMKYPAIVYFRESIDNTFANDQVYKQDFAYNVTVIYEDPDSTLPIQLSQLPMCRHVRHYTADNLNHDVFTLYF